MTIITAAETGAEIFEIADTDTPRAEFDGYADGFGPTRLPIGTGDASVAEFHEMLDGALVDIVRSERGAAYLGRVIARELRARAATFATAAERIAFVDRVGAAAIDVAGNNLGFLLAEGPVARALADIHDEAMATLVAEAFADEAVIAQMDAQIIAALRHRSTTAEVPRRPRRRRGGRRRQRRS